MGEREGKIVRLVLRGARLLTGPKFKFDRQPHDVLIEDGRFTAIEAVGAIANADTVVTLDHHLLVPGLINGHMHSHEHFQKGRTENLPLELWMHYVRTPMPIALTWRQVYLRTLIGAIESLRSGATSIVDDISLGASVNHTVIDAAFRLHRTCSRRHSSRRCVRYHARIRKKFSR
jgi:5-methylthioadenosine/S-adenosylhomocysteine deaminase